MTVGQYLLKRLEEAGMQHMFGVPGDYILDFYDQLMASPIEFVGTCSEQGAGFAADAYARVNGLGAVCVTYCVGGFNALNAVAGAYAEKSPLIIISGIPGLEERQGHPLLHHQVRSLNTQLQIFERVTAAAISVEDPKLAPGQIDDVIETCLREKRPVYIEFPRDVPKMRCASPKKLIVVPNPGSPEVLKEALQEASAMIRKAKKPVILGGVEIHRFGLQDKLIKLSEKSGIPVAATLLGKSVIREDHPLYLGIYEGAMGRKDVQMAVESSDCVIILGAFMTDINLGIYTASLDTAKSINASSEQVSIKHHHYDGLDLGRFIDGLAKAAKHRKNLLVKVKKEPRPFKPKPKSPITVSRFYQRINELLDKKTMVICDIGDSLFAASDLTIKARTEFLSPAYYTSMGFAIPAAIGAHVNKKRSRPIVFVGDGAFQMTGFELSAIARLGLNPIIFVMNNKGYTTERYIKDGSFNDIHNWSYHKMTDLLQTGWGCEVNTEGELEEAFVTAFKNKKSFSLINVHLDPYDRSDSLERLGKWIGKASEDKS